MRSASTLARFAPRLPRTALPRRPSRCSCRYPRPWSSSRRRRWPSLPRPLAVLVPLFVTVNMSLKTTEQAVDGNAFSLPSPLTLSSFAEAWSLTNFPRAFAISLFNSSFSRMLNLEISALEADGKGKVVSSPRVVTADQTKALIEQGTELPYQVATSSGATSIAFRRPSVLKTADY